MPNFHCFQRASGSPKPHSVLGVNAGQGNVPVFMGKSFSFCGSASSSGKQEGWTTLISNVYSSCRKNFRDSTLTVSRSFCGFLHYFFGQIRCLYYPTSHNVNTPLDLLPNYLRVFLPFPWNMDQKVSHLKAIFYKKPRGLLFTHGLFIKTVI